MVANQGQGEFTLALAKTKKSPLLVFAAAPAAGHTGPPLHLAQEMVGRGYEVIFMSSTEYKGAVEKVGAEWYECSDFWLPGVQEGREALPLGVARTLMDIENLFRMSSLVIRPHDKHLKEHGPISLARVFGL
jgi:hypothetical protein